VLVSNFDLLHPHLNCSLTEHLVLTNRSITELSDLADVSYQDTYGRQEFGEGMKLVLDAVHPDLTSPEKGDLIPTHLMPWRGGGLGRRGSNLSPRNSSASRVIVGRQ
jgi:hypothetical protein